MEKSISEIIKEAKNNDWTFEVEEGVTYSAYELKTPNGKSSDILAVFREEENSMNLVDWRWGYSLLSDEEIYEFIKPWIAKGE